MTLLKTCNICGLSKSLPEFAKNGKHPTSGAQRYRPECKPCYVEESARKKRQAIDDVLKELKIDLECSLCGYKKNRAALCFHHLDDSTKDFSIGGYGSFSKDKLRKEIEKCVLLCSNCHMEVHYPQKNISI